MTTVNEAIKRLKWNGKQHVAVAIWCEEDVLEQAEKRGIKITWKQAREIIDEIDRKQDCELGITWVTIDCYLDELPKAPYDKHDQASSKHPMYPAPLEERK